MSSLKKDHISRFFAVSNVSQTFFFLLLQLYLYNMRLYMRALFVSYRSIYVLAVTEHVRIGPIFPKASSAANFQHSVICEVHYQQPYLSITEWYDELMFLSY